MIELHSKVDAERILDDLEYYVNLLDAEDKTEWLQDPLVQKLDNFAGFPVYKFTWEDSKEVYVVVSKQLDRFIGGVVLTKFHKGYQVDFVGFRDFVKGSNLGARFYRYLIHKEDMIIVSDMKQTDSGKRLWRELFQFDDLAVYAYNFNTDEIYEVDDDYSSLVSNVELYAKEYNDSTDDIRLVASKNLTENLVLGTDAPLTEEGVGRIIKGVNTTPDVGPGEIKKQAAKFGNRVDKDGRPPLLHSKARKNSSPNTLFNLGLTERYTPLQIAIMEGGHLLEDDNVIDLSAIRKAKQNETVYDRVVKMGLFDDLPIDSRIVFKNKLYRVVSYNLLKLGRVESGNQAGIFPDTAIIIKDPEFYYTPVVNLIQVTGDEEANRFAIRLERLIDTVTKEKHYTKFEKPVDINKQVRENLDKLSVGYKIMAYDPDTAEVISIADKSIRFPLSKNTTLRVPNSKIYLSNNLDFVMRYYRGLTDDFEVLLTLEYNPEDIISGNNRDSESEFTVSKAKIKDFKILERIDENMSFTATERAKEAKRLGLEPGTDAWFAHWFSLPYMIDQRRSKKKRKPPK